MRDKFGKKSGGGGGRGGERVLDLFGAEKFHLLGGETNLTGGCGGNDVSNQP